MDFVETEEQHMLREAVRAIAEKFGHGYFTECARSGRKADELWDELASFGIPRGKRARRIRWRGDGHKRTCDRPRRARCSRMPAAPARCVAGDLRHDHRPLRDRRPAARLVASLRHRRAQDGLRNHRAHAGSNSHRISTTATRDGDAYRVRGTKYYISGADESESALVVTRTGVDEDTGRGGFRCSSSTSRAKGFRRRSSPSRSSLPRSSSPCSSTMWSSQPSASSGPRATGCDRSSWDVNPERIMSAAMAGGIGRYALDKASAYARDRSVWGTPIGRHQGLEHPLAKAKIDLEMARLMCQKAAWTYDVGLDAGEAANMAKYAAAEAAIAALDQAIQTHGGNGMASEYGLADMWGTARLLRTAPISREMILNFVAQHSLDLPKSY